MRRALALVALLVLLCGRQAPPGASAEADEPRTAPDRPGDAPATRVPFVAYVQDTQEGGTRVVVYYPDEDRSEVVAISEPGDPPLTLRPTVTSWPHFTVPPPQPQAPPQARRIFLDSRTGHLVQPDSSLHLGEGAGSSVLDVTRERALLVEYERDAGKGLEHAPTGRLYLCKGPRRTELGRVWLPSMYAAAPRISHHLSPDGNYVLFDGPEGSYGAELPSGQVEPRPECQQWLADGSGYLNRWRGGDKVTRWKLIEPHSGRVLAEGEGYVDDISPGGTYWVIRNEDRDTEPPVFVRLAPGRQPSDTERVAQGPWAIQGRRAEFWACSRRTVAEGRTALCRIGLQGHQKRVVAGLAWSPQVLTLEHGGRLAVRVGEPPAPGEAGVVRRQHSLITDFQGNEIVRLRCEGPLVKLGEAVCVLVLDDEGQHIKRIDLMTGEAEVVLNTDAGEFSLGRLGNTALVLTSEEAGSWRLRLAREDGRVWPLLAEGLRERPYWSPTW
jgi:hypothetical protein